MFPSIGKQWFFLHLVMVASKLAHTSASLPSTNLAPRCLTMMAALVTTCLITEYRILINHPMHYPMHKCKDLQDQLALHLLQFLPISLATNTCKAQCAVPLHSMQHPSSALSLGCCALRGLCTQAPEDHRPCPTKGSTNMRTTNPRCRWQMFSCMACR